LQSAAPARENFPGRNLRAHEHRSEKMQLTLMTQFPQTFE
jgi:hypothetical protein